MIDALNRNAWERPYAAGEFCATGRDVDQAWYAVRVRSNFELTVANVLSGRGYEVLLPTYRVRRKRGARTVESTLPIFSGYTFARFCFEARLPIVSTSGVVHIVTSGRQALPIPSEEIEAIRGMTERGADVRPCPFVRSGDVVKIVSGPLAGLTGVLLEDGGRSRLAVSISLLQRSVSAEVDGDSIQFLRRGALA